jgi:hypothetical protein
MSALAASERFQAFSGQHWLLLAVFAVGVVLVPAWGRSHCGTDREHLARHGYAVVLGVATVTMQVYYAVEPGHFDLGTSLPLASVFQVAGGSTARDARKCLSGAGFL